ncbi:MAG: nucleoside deaminase, partial [Candidatus Methanomethylophilaceae archaeon]|nr:nucleoside deaminase [Candidatus Methanomethylophilaceae archaeon]
MPTDEEMLDMAIDEALSGIRSGHGGPFGCVISKDGEVVALGHNMVLENNDPTAHGEVSAIRRACSILRTIDLSSCTLYTNSEPCPMCKAAISWAKVGKVVYAVTMRDANDVVLRAIFNAAKGAAANIMEVRLDGAPRVIENQNDGERVSTIFTQEELDDNYGLALMSLPGDGIPRADRDSLAALADSLGATPGAWFEMSLYK